MKPSALALTLDHRPPGQPPLALGAGPDPVLDGLLRAASTGLACPIALLIAHDPAGPRIVGEVGLGASALDHRPLRWAQAIDGVDQFEVGDARHDPWFAADPFVTGPPHMCLCAGVRVAADDRTRGVLCVIDTVPRRLEPAQRTLLAVLARTTGDWLRQRCAQTDQQLTQGLLVKVALHMPGFFYQYRQAADGAASFPFASEGMTDIFELTPEHVRLDAAAAFGRLHPADLAQVRSTIADSARDLTLWTQRFRVRLPERGERWMEAKASPEPCDDGATLWHGFIQDVTSRREDELLRQQQLATARAGQAGSEFLSHASHELRTPLHAVLGFSELLDSEPGLPARARTYVTQLRRAGEHLLGVVDGMLDLARIEAGARTLTLEPVEISPLMDATLALIAPLASERGVHVMAVQGSAGVAALADPRAIAQVLLNLLSNGIKYNRARGRLWVELQAIGSEAVIAVSDEGIGLSDAQRDRLFQPFERLGAERGPVQGTGLGLVICKQLVESMRGRMLVHARSGGGCRFEVRLPRADVAPVRG